jgi:hydrogenase maturation protease
MKASPVLLIGLGNPLMGDEGIGWHLAERLREDPRLPANVEVICGGTDLLRCANQFEGRRHVILVDALLDHGRPGEVVVTRDCFEDFAARQGHAHSLSALQAVELLRAVTPGLEAVRFTLAAIRIAKASVRPELSAALAAGIPQILDRLLDQLKGGNGRCA